MTEIHHNSGTPTPDRKNLERLLIGWLAAVATVVAVAAPQAPVSAYTYLAPAIVIVIGSVHLAGRRKDKQPQREVSQRSGRTWILVAAPYLAFGILLIGVVLSTVANSWLPDAAAALLITGLVIGVSPDYLGRVQGQSPA